MLTTWVQQASLADASANDIQGLIEAIGAYRALASSREHCEAQLAIIKADRDKEVAIITANEVKEVAIIRAARDREVAVLAARQSGTMAVMGSRLQLAERVCELEMERASSASRARMREHDVEVENDVWRRRALASLRGQAEALEREMLELRVTAARLEREVNLQHNLGMAIKLAGVALGFWLIWVMARFMTM